MSANKGGDNYLWTCEKNGENFRFKNKAGKYLGFRSMSDNPYNFKIDPAMKVNEGCLPLYGVTIERYLLVAQGGTGFEQANKTYNKNQPDGSGKYFSSDFIFEEVDVNAKTLTIQTDPAGPLATFSWNGKS